MKRPKRKSSRTFKYGTYTSMIVVEDVLERATQVYELERGIYKDGRHYIRYEFVQVPAKKEKKHKKKK